MSWEQGQTGSPCAGLADNGGFERGRHEGWADVSAKLRAVLDPSDSQHWNLDGLLNEVSRLKEADLNAARTVLHEVQRVLVTLDDGATHRCKVCRARWRANPPMPKEEHDRVHCLKPDCPLLSASWSLVSETCGKCCDLAPMGAQIEELLSA